MNCHSIGVFKQEVPFSLLHDYIHKYNARKIWHAVIIK